MAPALKQWMKFKEPMVLVQCAIAELLGTMFFVFLGSLSVSVSSPFTLNEPLTRVIVIALGYGLGLALAVSATAGVSGGHINPAVSICLAAVGLVDVLSAVVYIVAQIVGAIFGAGLAKAIVPSAVKGILGQTVPGIATSTGQAFLAEMLFTAILVYTIFACAVDPRGPGALAPLLIGLSVLIDNAVGVPLTGASMNPARSFGPAVWSGVWTDQWIYWIAPILGALLVAIPYTGIYLMPLAKNGGDDGETKDDV
ncbi:hypothetical protein CLOM_g14279 [Closterium sp. NIES-68]|nr:hypothetical protein CLOM_g24556 [Closterium sp. NIES-68]GJP55304.1 hypothetical protein CLOM_g14279 [Closterium sp. NIES-68]GJP70970.1 hypothetical protein CLOP_g1863 [Closterium sp. NIES-67]